MLSKVGDKYDKALNNLLCAKIKEKNGDCSNIDLKINECEYGEYKIYCVIKYTWDYKYDNTDYNLSTLASLKHVYGDYPADKKFGPMLEEEYNEIENRYKKKTDGVYCVAGVLEIVSIILAILIGVSKDIVQNDKNRYLVFIGIFFLVVVGITALIETALKKKCFNKKEKIEKQRTQEKIDRKNIMCNKIKQDIKDDKYKL